MRLKTLVKQVTALVTDEMLAAFHGDGEGPPQSLRDEWEKNVGWIQPGDVWVEFYPFVLSKVRGGWELADGDPVCNWCGNTFTHKFPPDVKPRAILKRMLKSLKEGLIVTMKQFREYLPGHVLGVAQKPKKMTRTNRRRVNSK